LSTALFPPQLLSLRQPGRVRLTLLLRAPASGFSPRAGAQPISVRP